VKRFLVVFCLLAWLPIAAMAADGLTVYFKGSDHELEVYRINGREPGPTLMIMGGIQGDEPGGYLAADLYADMRLKRGNLIVVPRANFYSILLNNRGPNGDMNRKFSSTEVSDPDGGVVDIIKQLMGEADYFLNLHDGSGFYHPDYIDSLHNPMRFGQSIIADTDVYQTATGRTLNLKGMAERVIGRVNESIHEPEYHYNFNNHNTMAASTQHKEQRKSATYYMLTQLGKPAFASETSKEIRDFRKRVVFQAMVISAFMQEIGIEPDNAGPYVDPPQLEYLLVSVNGNPPVAVYDGKHILLSRGDKLTVTDIRSNYRRGLVANVVDLGQLNDNGRQLTISAPTEIEVKKDMFPCGRVYVDVLPEAGRTWLILSVDGVGHALAPEEALTVPRGAKLVLKDLVYLGGFNHNLTVNFKGFVTGGGYNDGEDRGIEIDSATLMPRYAQPGPDGSQRFRVSGERGNDAVVNFYIDIKG